MVSLTRREHCLRLEQRLDTLIKQIYHILIPVISKVRRIRDVTFDQTRFFSLRNNILRRLVKQVEQVIELVIPTLATNANRTKGGRLGMLGLIK